MTCSRLRLASVTLDGIYHLHPYSWDGLFGYPGKRGENLPVIGRPGRFFTPEKEAEERVFTLGLLIRPHDDTGLVTFTGGPCEHLEANQDEILEIMGQDTEQRLEWDMCNGTTRYLDVEFVDPSPIAHDGLIGRRLPMIGRAAYPQWRDGGAVVTTAMAVGTNNLNPGGSAPVDDSLLTFTAASSIANGLTDDIIEVDPDGGGTVTVNVLTGAVVQGGVPAPGRVVGAGSGRLFRLRPNVNNPLTVTGATVSVGHRPHWW